MAFTIFPTSKEELQKVLDTKWPVSKTQKLSTNNNIQKDILKFYDSIMSKNKFDAPLAFEPGPSKKIKVLRALKTQTFTIPSISGVTLSFGDGSRGGRGINNKGFKYEDSLYEALVSYIEIGEDSFISHSSVKSEIKDIIKLVEVNGYIIYDVIAAGSSNKKRNIPIDETGIHIPSVRDLDLGHTISDITIKTKNSSGQKKETYISAKFGNTVSFLNCGVKQWFKEEEMSKGIITDPTGLRLLKILGISPDKFCDTFIKYVPGQKSKRSEKAIASDINKKDLIDLAKITVGYGYIMVHKNVNGTKVINMNIPTMESQLHVDSVTISYPLDGTIKSVKSTVVMSGLTIEFTIRATDGTIYPTHMVATYKYTKLKKR